MTLDEFDLNDPDWNNADTIFLIFAVGSLVAAYFFFN